VTIGVFVNKRIHDILLLKFFSVTELGVVSGIGFGMGVFDFGVDSRRGRGSLGDEFTAYVICIVAKRLIGCGCRLGW